MKKLAHNCRMIIGLLLISLIPSCSKDMNTSVIHEMPASKAVLNIRATKWELVSEGLYQCNFIGIVRYVSNTSKATVYVVDDSGNEELDISLAPATFLGGEIFESHDSNNILVSFKTSTGKPLPFTYLNLKIVFE
jgi:hypothetical protein